MTWLGSGLMRGFIFISSCSLLGSTLSPTSSWPLSHSALSSDHDWCLSYPTLPKSYWQTVRCWDHLTIRPLGSGRIWLLLFKAIFWVPGILYGTVYYLLAQPVSIKCMRSDWRCPYPFYSALHSIWLPSSFTCQLKLLLCYSIQTHIVTVAFSDQPPVFRWDLPSLWAHNAFPEISHCLYHTTL